MSHGRILLTGSCLLPLLLCAGCIGELSPGDEEAGRSATTTCGARLERFPVAGPYNLGWDPDALVYSCDGARANSDYYLGGTASHPSGHRGNDIFGQRGTPIVAARRGRVAYIANEAVGGLNVGIVDECGWTTYYAHLDSLAPGLSQGQSVQAGAAIGGMGDSGSARGTGVHLHFSVYPDGSYYQGIDPFPLLQPLLRTACSGGGPAGAAPGRADLLWYEGWNEHAISTALNSGSRLDYGGKWVTGWGKPDWAGAGDFNGDGRADVAWYEHWNQASISVGRSSGERLAPQGKWISGLGQPDWAGVGDFNGDGKADIAWYEHWNQGAVTVLLPNGSSFRNAGKWLTGFGRPDWAGVGDFNGDGKADIAWYEHWNQGAVTVVLSDGSSFRNAGKWLTGFGRPDWAGAGDFDGDGKADLVWYEHWNRAGFSLALSSGSELGYAGQWLSGVGRPDWAGVGDLDGDGRADIAWYEHWNQGGVSAILSTGSGLKIAGRWLEGFGNPDWAAVGKLR